ncbi:MAG: 30S ribosome-binding factor RbfA [Gammaproteobacteria bacterium]
MNNAPVSRAERVGAEIAHALASAIERECSDPRLYLVTITGVRMSPDLKYAQVNVSSVNPDADGAIVITALVHAASRLRRSLAKAVRLRVVPRLDFRWDNSGERRQHLEALIVRGLPRGGDGT